MFKMLLNSNKVEIGFQAKNFNLINIDGKFYNLDDIRKKNGLVIAFICNHCPYVKDIMTRIVEDFNVLQKLQIGTAAIMPNDIVAYPEDSFENMQKFAKNYNFKFPYLLDTEQTVAKNYNAVCTPDFFCFNNENKLFYRGRLDNIKFKNKYTSRDTLLINAFKKMIENRFIENNQGYSIGCSIKWKT